MNKLRLGIIRLYCGNSGKKGFYNIQEFGLAKALVKHNIDVFIFFLVDNKKYKDIREEHINKNITILYYPAFKLLNHGIVNPKFISDYRIQLVHLLSDNQICTARVIKYCRNKDIPIYTCIGTLSSDSNNKMKKNIMDILNIPNLFYYKRIHNVVKNRYIYNELKNKGIKNVQVIPVGLDTDNICRIYKSKREIREELCLPTSKNIIMFVGRLEKYKNPLYSISLINELLKFSNSYHLIIIGDGSLKGEVKNKIKELKLDENITLISKVPNSYMHKYYLAADTFVNFNNKEIFGMSILEAMYDRCPVIAVNSPGPNDIITDNVNGILMPNYNLSNWAVEIEKIIKNKSMAEKAHERVCENFCWDKIASSYIKLYEKLIGDKYEEIQSSNCS
ncbi:MAG: glycosyltransferase family 4 protein [Clostridium sp.]|nr:glycosyltransferase family 4 protein [Clostridium sp.]